MQNYNHIRDTIDISNESAPGSEPVTLAEMKVYLRLRGFIDDNDSTAIPEFTDDDELIEEFIKTARQGLEEELGASIVPHTWKAVGVTNEAGDIRLWYGPVRELTSVKDDEDNTYETDKTKVVGDNLTKPCDSCMTVEYEAGYENIPSPLITEIKRMVAYMYENRGDVDGLEGYKYSADALKYNRKPWLV